MIVAERLDYGSSDFDFIRALMLEVAGISLHEGKKELVYSRLVKRLRHLGVEKFSDYVSILKTDNEEVFHCINFLTTNVTSFFREQHHFDFIRENLLKDKRGEEVRIWSAGCATGEEPYSIAFTAADFPEANVKILATDLDSQVIQKARGGVYKDRSISAISPVERKRWFEKGIGSNAGLVRVTAPFRESIEFGTLNLKQPFSFTGRFDAIFCRNVMIYFDNTFRAHLLDRFASVLKPGGYLFLGHSESMLGLSNSFQIVGKTIHRRIGAQ